MPDDEDKMKRAAELDAAIKAHDAKRKDGENDLARNACPVTMRELPSTSYFRVYTQSSTLA